MANDIYRALEGGRVEREQHRENSARLATTYADYITTGVGTLVDPTLLLFDTIYIAEPAVTAGVVLLEPQPDPEDLEASVWPLASAGVYQWERDERGHYLGAYLFFTVGYIGTQGDPDVELRHFVVFTGPAYKTLQDSYALMPEFELETRLPPAVNPDNYPAE